MQVHAFSTCFGAVWWASTHPKKNVLVGCPIALLDRLDAIGTALSCFGWFEMGMVEGAGNNMFKRRCMPHNGAVRDNGRASCTLFFAALLIRWRGISSQAAVAANVVASHFVAPRSCQDDDYASQRRQVVGSQWYTGTVGTFFGPPSPFSAFLDCRGMIAVG
jgi:hypothetical protein